MPVHTSGSTAFMDRKLENRSSTGASAVAIAAISWAKRPPPRARTRAPTRTMSAAPSREGSARMANWEPPSTDWANHAWTAVSGGMSTYPRARCSPQARK